MPSSASIAPGAREQALLLIAAQRHRHRAKPLAVRAACALASALSFVIAAPLLVLFTELGIPLLLVALRLAALEFTWAAKHYAWVAWKWAHACTHFETAHPTRKALIAGGILASTLTTTALAVLLLH